MLCLIALILLATWRCWLIRLLVVRIVMGLGIDSISPSGLWLWRLRLILLWWRSRSVTVLLICRVLFDVSFVVAVRVVDVLY